MKCADHRLYSKKDATLWICMFALIRECTFVIKARMQRAATWTLVVIVTLVIHKNKLDPTYQRLHNQLFDHAFFAISVLSCNKCKSCEKNQGDPCPNSHRDSRYEKISTNNNHEKDKSYSKWLTSVTRVAPLQPAALREPINTRTQEVTEGEMPVKADVLL